MFDITYLPDNAYEAEEQLGTKFKFWFLDSDDQQTLFKQGRENTGENWAEKICSELANIIGIPNAEYHLSSWRNRLGVISPSFVNKGERLVLGNEILSPNVKRSQYGTNHHLIRKVTSFLRLPLILLPYRFSNTHLSNACDVFIGYLMFDALVGNTDRHDENWGVILSSRGFELAPTYDHASSLGREISDNERSKRLNTNDKNYSVEAYAARARSALYNSIDDKHPLTTLEAFLQVGETSEKAKHF
jgi:hypothetical protein